MKLGKSGSSLVELMAVSAIMVVFGGALFGTFSAFKIALYRQDKFYDVNRSARIALDTIAQDVREAIRIETSHNGDNSADDVLVLRLASLDASGEPSNISTQFDYVTYHLDDNDPTLLIRDVDVQNGSTRNGGADSSDVLAESIEDIYFSEDGTGLSDLATVTGVRLLNVQISSQKSTVGGSDQSVQLDSDMVLRNKL